ncbi:MAG: hypothetical protein IPL78_16820 [Chloroflexi bacterium]|nr:hypothetical protein [Chloroflexota bacterium]
MMLAGLRRGRVPVILQMTTIECGAACLAMLLSYYGRKTRLSECRDWLGTGRDGISAYEIAEAGQAMGLDLEGYAVAAEDIADVPLPAIAFWDDNHFVVIEQGNTPLHSPGGPGFGPNPGDTARICPHVFRCCPGGCAQGRFCAA